MTTTASRHPTAFSALFPWRSLKARVTIFTLIFFLIAIWPLALYSSYTLHNDMEKTLGEQQFSTVSIIAADINDELEERLKTLEIIAAKITPNILGNAASTQKVLESQISVLMLFNFGATIIRHDGIVIADVPISARRIGVNYGDRDWVIESFKKNKSIIGKPAMGKKSKAPVFVMTAPIRDTNGKMIGAILGVTDLSKPSFLSKITDNSYGKTGGYLLVTPQLRTIVYSTDKKRIMEVLPAPGINQLIDSYLQGYEGSGITTRPSDGVEVLSSARGIPLSGWYLVALMPTEEAFAPMHAMQQRMLLAAIFLTLLLGGLTWWMLKRQLAPVFTAIKTLGTLSDSDRSPQPLPITRQDEIGELIGGFNHLLEILGQREEALSESASRLNRAEKAAKLGNWKLMLNTKEFIGSPGAKIIYGVEGDIISFDDARKCTLPEYIDILNKGLTDLITKDIPYSLDIKICRPTDGKIIDVHSIAEYDKESNIVYGVIQDITERKQMEDELKQRESQYRLLAKNMRDQVWLMDLNLKPTYISPSVAKARGYTLEEIEQLPLDKHLTAKSLQAAMEFFAIHMPKALADPSYFLKSSLELEFCCKNGSTFCVDAAFSLIRDENGKPLSLLGVGRDITDRKRAEYEKGKLEAQLQQSQKMEAIGTLAGGIAHDFNNILAAIIGYTEMAVEEDQSEIQKQYLQETLSGAERARNLVKQILTFSRQDDHEKKPLDIKVLLKEAIKFLRSSIPTTIEINQHLTEDSCNIIADPTQMHQVIMNLCTNASHAMKETGGTLKIELANVELAKDGIPNHPNLLLGHYTELTISDTGYGIDPAIVQRIFDPFFTTKSVDEGTGLGLSVVYGIVKSHNGAINVNSEPGKGAAFHVYLPRITYGEDMKVDRRNPVTGGTERILFVDDEPSLVDIAKSTLSSLGYDVTGVLSSVEALNIFNTEPQRFDLIITDMTLPKMTGIDLSRKLLQIRPDIPIILCSGIKEPDTEAQIKTLGIKTYLSKPLTRRELSQAIRNTLDGDEKSLLP